MKNSFFFLESSTEFLLINGEVIETFCSVKCEFTTFGSKKEILAAVKRRSYLSRFQTYIVALALNLDHP